MPFKTYNKSVIGLGKAVDLRDLLLEEIQALGITRTHTYLGGK